MSMKKGQHRWVQALSWLTICGKCNVSFRTHRFYKNGRCPL